MQRVVRSPVWVLAVVLGGLYLAHDLGAKQAIQYDSGVVIASGAVRIQYIPNPNDIVNLVEGTPYVVPAEKLLIITDWAVTDAKAFEASGPPPDDSISPRVRVNGVDVWGGGYGYRLTTSGTGSNSAASSQTSTGGGFLSGSLRSGIRANAGQSITLHANSSYASPTMFASGYLAKAN